MNIFMQCANCTKIIFGVNENDVGILKSQVWEIGGKLLLTEREKEKLEENFQSKRCLYNPWTNRMIF